MGFVERVERDFVTLSEFLDGVIATDLAARIERQQTAGFDPQNAHHALAVGSLTGAAKRVDNAVEGRTWRPAK
jgi:hypothetical protein